MREGQLGLRAFMMIRRLLLRVSFCRAPRNSTPYAGKSPIRGLSNHPSKQRLCTDEDVDDDCADDEGYPGCLIDSFFSRRHHHHHLQQQHKPFFLSQTSATIRRKRMRCDFAAPRRPIATEGERIHRGREEGNWKGRSRPWNYSINPYGTTKLFPVPTCCCLPRR